MKGNCYQSCFSVRCVPEYNMQKPTDHHESLAFCGEMRVPLLWQNIF